VLLLLLATKEKSNSKENKSVREVNEVDAFGDAKEWNNVEYPHDKSEDNHEHSENTANPCKYFHVSPLCFFLMLLHHLFI